MGPPYDENPNNVFHFISAKDTPMILVLFNAGPLDIAFAKLTPHTTAILEVFFPAQSTGKALYNVLTASAGPDSVPAARLPATWPAHIEQVSVAMQICRCNYGLHGSMCDQYTFLSDQIASPTNIIC